MAGAPLATRMRPRTLEEVVGQRHLIGSGRPLTSLVQSGHIPSLLLWAVASGVADARKVMDRAKGSLIPVVLFVDEVHRWSKSQQDVLLPSVEEGTITLIGATTENPYFSLVSPLLSRCLLLRLEPLDHADLRALMERALADTE